MISDFSESYSLRFDKTKSMNLLKGIDFIEYPDSSNG